ncbi:MAG: hypothetical protein B0W54_03490 [Cellvibrio sp. 79]|nr:MAG: hypothetical protein B0W54_03490 [Cellvibrio sp. 79]
MSLILDALNRADHERKNQDVVPGLNTVHPAPVMVVEEKSGNKNGLYIAISLSIIALAVSVYWFIGKPKDAVEANAQVDHAQAAKPPAINTKPALTQQPETKAPAGADTTSQSITDGQSVVENRSAESLVTSKPTAAVEQLYSAPETQAASADPKVNELYSAEEPAVSESIEEPFPESVPFAGESTHITNTGRGGMENLPSRNFANIINVQDFNELPWNTKQQIPTISYQRHNFLAGGVSTVVINGQTLGVGNIAASSQLVVQEIFEDGVVLKRGNVIFKLRALNGWINM